MFAGNMCMSSKMLKGHLPRVIYDQVYECTKITLYECVLPIHTCFQNTCRLLVYLVIYDPG
jgi:hypothetical protein